MRLKKKISFLLLFFITFGLIFSSRFNVVHADTTSKVYYTVDSGILMGKDFNIYVNCENISDLYGASLDWKFDPSVIQVTSVEPGMLYNALSPGSNYNTPVKNIDNTKGELNYLLMFLGNVPGITNATGNIFIIHAKALKAASIVLKTISDNSDLSLGGNNVRIKLSNSNASLISAALNTGSIDINTNPAILNSFTSDLSAPQTAGTTINFTAAATSDYGVMYQFWIKDSSGWSMVQDYSTKNTLSWRPLKGGDYVVSVYVKDTYSIRYVDNFQTMNYTINNASPVTISSVNVDKQSPQIIGSTINFTASATGGIELLYQFWVKDTNGWSLAQDYSSKNTFSWKPSKPGDYIVSTYVKDKYSNNVADALMQVNYKITETTPVVINSLTSDIQSPQLLGNTINFTASATGGSELLYQFWVKDANGWSMAQDYSAKNTFTWKPSRPGDYVVSTYVKDKNSTKIADALMTVNYKITTAPVAVNSLVSDIQSPQLLGSTVNFTASATGGSELLYQFWVKDANGWSMAQDYSSKNTLAWKPTKAGDYIVSVYVKDKYSSGIADALKQVSYKISTPPPVVLNSLTSDSQSPQLLGNTVNFTASASGGSELIYQFWVKDANGWSMAQDYSSNNTFAWKPSKSGDYIVSVYVKDKNSTNIADALKQVTYKISTPPPVVLNSLTSDSQSPQLLGNTVNFTASASGGSELIYQFWVKDANGWSMAQDYSSNNTFAWKPSKSGDYIVSVYVKDKNSTNIADALKQVTYKITTAPVVLNSLTSDIQSPQALGSTVNFTASASGGSELIYQFWVKDTNGWTLAQDYSSNNTFAWKPSKPGDYIVSVYVKDKNSSNIADALKQVTYKIN